MGLPRGLDELGRASGLAPLPFTNGLATLGDAALEGPALGLGVGLVSGRGARAMGGEPGMLVLAVLAPLYGIALTGGLGGDGESRLGLPRGGGTPPSAPLTEDSLLGGVGFGPELLLRGSDDPGLRESSRGVL